MDHVTDSQMSLPVKSRSSPGRSSRTFSKGSRRSNKRGKKSYTSVVLEEPSKEDRGFAFQSRYSLKSSSKPLTQKSGTSSINIKISRNSLASNKTGSPIKRTLSNEDSKQSRILGSSVRKIPEVMDESMRKTFSKNSSKSPTRILAAS